MQLQFLPAQKMSSISFGGLGAVLRQILMLESRNMFHVKRLMRMPLKS